MATILGGEKQDDLLKDDVREIANAFHWSSIGSSDPGGGLSASPRDAGCGIYNRRRCWRVPHLLGAGANRVHFPCGRCAEIMGLSRVARDEPMAVRVGKKEGWGFL